MISTVKVDTIIFLKNNLLIYVHVSLVKITILDNKICKILMEPTLLIFGKHVKI